MQTLMGLSILFFWTSLSLAGELLNDQGEDFSVYKFELVNDAQVTIKSFSSEDSYLALKSASESMEFDDDAGGEGGSELVEVFFRKGSYDQATVQR